MTQRTNETMKYSDVLAQWLVDLGYTHCFFVAGGNIMHLLESCSHKLTCIPVVHEVAAGIAAEYFNEVHLGSKAFAMVTAGPGLTNIVTALGGAYLESRELLVIGGQVKTADLNRGEVRQRGIQEIDGVAIAAAVTEKSILMEEVVDRAEFAEMTFCGRSGRKGPVFLEIPLDVQGARVDPVALTNKIPSAVPYFEAVAPSVIAEIAAKLKKSERPVILLGAGIDRATTEAMLGDLEKLGVPVMATWNAMDRVPADHPMYFGRPNTWGQRYSNILLQQADLVIALGTRLSLQQTGFNWQGFAPVGEVVQVDCDRAELQKGHPKVDLPVCGDANAVLKELVKTDAGDHSAWVSFCREVRSAIPLVEPVNNTGEGYLSPYNFAETLSGITTEQDIVIPCSSGSAFTVMMQTFAQKRGQRVVTNKGLASMGYGLSGAIGAALAGKGRRTILVEGDGGFIQNLQELGTVAANKLNLKIFVFDDHGYASIRMTQINYFGGRYVGCDTETGLGIPKWEPLFEAYSIPAMRVGIGYENDPEFIKRMSAPGPAAFLVHIDPKQTYFPKIASRVTASGSMESNPLHLMTPDLDDATAAKVFRYVAGPVTEK
ncbi:thiamine pyrophosphate-binding protein [Terriglobus saanensis]|uniref:Thiamine pyrophosphate central domain-containing protein n=1 Tax=Terriglobus saanensis (strain ATCC BAA-1853 / DSM 23119 / SP1PR4) TaxID=401053 RepID=E8V1M0_TERSS|nr:thiamine pyrophosphate-binding protein [Terriglobus saanensis]ADV82301.1 thiamine pyrophosphate central domain-containing protein [Terriglobus saanensis SP1PR4]